MDWWQILLILLGSISVGVLGGILLSYLINRFLIKRLVKKPEKDFGQKREVAPVVAAQMVKEPISQSPLLIKRLDRKPEKNVKQKHEVAPATAGQIVKEPGSRVPFLGGRSLLNTIIILALGLIVGAGLGLGYWAMSPINATVETGWPPVRIAKPLLDVYQSTVKIRITGPGSAYASRTTLRRWGEYYADSRMNTTPFFEFLSQKLAVELPEYSHSAGELSQIVRAVYAYKSDVPAIEIKVTSPDEREAYFLASMIPQAFQDYLVVEEYNLRLEEHQRIQEEEQGIKTDLLKAEGELAQMKRYQKTVGELTAVSEEVKRLLGPNPDLWQSESRMRY